MSEVDLKPLNELGDEIRRWILDQSKDSGISTGRDDERVKMTKEQEELYDF